MTLKDIRIIKGGAGSGFLIDEGTLISCEGRGEGVSGDVSISIISTIASFTGAFRFDFALGRGCFFDLACRVGSGGAGAVLDAFAVGRRVRGGLF